MEVSKLFPTKTVAFSTLLACGIGLWLWLRRKKQPPDYDAVMRACITRHLHEVHVISTTEEWDQCLEQLLRDTKKSKILGIDCEWVMRHPVALLQIASSSGYCVLVRLCHLGPDNIPQSLEALLSDRSILKLGVAVNDDAKKLLRDFGLKLNGCVDLRHIVQRVRGVYRCRSLGLQGLAKSVLNFNLSKDFKVRCGNWEARRLSPRQIEYAALDALVAIDIFTSLVIAKVTGSDPRLYPRCVSQVSMDVFLSASRNICQGTIDAGFSRQLRSERGGPRHGKHTEKNGQMNDQERRKQSGSMYGIRSRPLWDNYKVSDNPLVVKLKFEPSGRPKSDRNYYLQQKDNMCVVCGSTEGYSRKFIVPQEYRKFFPLLLKEHTSHDVLLMCPPCHRKSSDCDVALRQQLANECSAPLNSGENSLVFQDHFMQQVKSAGRALKFKRESIPEARIRELERILMDYYGVPELTSELIEEATIVDIRQARENHVIHGKMVVKYMAEHGGLLQFQSMWRRHFISTMRPQHLPAYWSVDYIPENWKEESDEEAKDDDIMFVTELAGLEKKEEEDESEAEEEEDSEEEEEVEENNEDFESEELEEDEKDDERS